MSTALATRRAAIDRDPRARRLFSPASLGLVDTAERIIRATARGVVLDVGCGTMPYRDLIEAAGADYVGLDVEARIEGVTHVCSATNMYTVTDASIDVVLCSEVLEHVAEPATALAEMARVLRPDGQLIVTVPFLGRLHEEPHDYYRYTEHGLRTLLDAAGFRLDRLEITGSVFSLLGHQVSTGIMLATWRFPVIRWLALAANVAFVVAPARTLDRLLGPARRKLPLGYVATASRVES